MAHRNPETDHKSEPPALNAYRSEHGQLLVWCVYERRWHFHGGCEGPGTADGHRGAHCIEVTPYRKTGYYIREVGPFTPVIRRRRGR